MNMTQKKPDGFTNQRILVVPESLSVHCRNHPIMESICFTDIGFFPYAMHHFRERSAGALGTILICCVEGSGWVQTNDGRRQFLSPGHTAIIPAGTPHQYGADEADPWSIYWIHVAGSQVSLFVGEEPWVASLHARDLKRWIILFEQCWELLELGVTVPTMLDGSQIIRQMLAILHHYRTNTLHSDKQNDYLMQAIQYMKQRLHKTINLTELAQHVNVSKSYLIALFKQQTGYAPIDYLLRMKIQRACRELDMTDRSIKDIAAQLGFHDPYYFSRQFSRVMSISPTAYRQLNKG